MEIVIQLQGIVSPRLIRECLDEKYKQKYRSNNAKKQKKNHDSAAISPLSEQMESKEILLDAQGNTLVEPLRRFNPTKNNLECTACQSKEVRIIELEKALRKTTQLPKAENLLSDRKLRFIIFKDKHETMITDAIQKCNTSCCLYFNSDHILVGITPDTSQVDYS